jgi:hypothetical protein
VSEAAAAGDREAVRILLTPRAQAIEFRTWAICAVHALVTSVPDRLRERLRDLPLGVLLTDVRRTAQVDDENSEEFATTMAMRATARRALARPTGGRRTGHRPRSYRGRVRSEAAWGKSVREIERCLKRDLVRQFFGHLESLPSTT